MKVKHDINTQKKPDTDCIGLKTGGDKGSRTPDLLNAIQALYQLSYAPKAHLLYHKQIR